MDEQRTYAAPSVEDLGDLVDLTAAVATTGTEDGAAKNSPLHHNLSLPGLP